jgi:Holliday junction resolvase RusA-like endonuclease
VRPHRLIDLPLPPSVNAIYRKTRHGVHKSAAYRRWLINADADYLTSGRQPSWTAGPAKIVIEVVQGKGWRSRDLDNMLKPLLDWLVTRGMLADDSAAHVRRVEIYLSQTVLTTPSRVLIRITPATS